MNNTNTSSAARLDKLPRRDFLRTALFAAGTGVLPCPLILAGSGANEKLNIGVIGASGKGASDTNDCASENIVALCDVDEVQCAAQRKRYEKAKFYRDFRQMLETEKSLDAVIVATPDHVHAPASVMAMRMGKHVYCQKPLVHDVHEARVMRETAREKRVVTQMGNQGSAEDGLRRGVEVIQAGVLGPVRQVYVWSNRPIWPQGQDRPAGEDPVPANLDWDLWLGPAPQRPYKANTYHPTKWRGWQDFGTGALGDMACHTANLPFRALRLGYPNVIEAESTGINRETYPLKSRIRYDFPAQGDQPAVSLWWFDGGFKPNPDQTKAVLELLGEVPGSGCLVIGDRGQLFSPDDYGARFFLKLSGDKQLVDGGKHDAIKAVPRTIPRNPFRSDADYRHHQEWIAGCKGGPTPYSSFEYAAVLTETILLGCIALRVGRRIEWDSAALQASNAPEAAKLIKREYREGWRL